MPALTRPPVPLTVESAGAVSPLLPTLVVASFKGGVWKTSFAVSIAERLAFSGVRVLLITCDPQQDARSRLGVGSQAGDAPVLARGPGSVTVVAASASVASEILYRGGAARLGQGSFQAVVVDTAPTIQSGMLPGVTMVVPLDGEDAIRNAVTMLRQTPANTGVVLVRVNDDDDDSWLVSAEAIEQAAGRVVDYHSEALPRSKSIAEAHNNQSSVWSLRRAGPTKRFLEAVDSIAHAFSQRLSPRVTWLRPPSPSSGAFIQGWDSDDAS